MLEIRRFCDICGSQIEILPYPKNEQEYEDIPQGSLSIFFQSSVAFSGDVCQTCFERIRHVMSPNSSRRD